MFLLFQGDRLDFQSNLIKMKIMFSRWCGGEEGDKCRRGRCRILFILPVLLLPIVILFIIVTHLSGFGSVMTSASQQPPDPTSTPALDNPISVDPTAPIIFERESFLIKLTFDSYQRDKNKIVAF